MPSPKLRTDYTLRGDLKDNMWSIFVARIKPAIRRAFHFDISHYEYMQVGRYGAEHRGFFRAHRDNFSTISRHRRYAMTLNLNDGYEGGYLRFPEYGNRQYRPKSGDAVIFSTALLHEALPVTKGERFVLVSFFWGEAEVPLFEESKRIKAMGKAAVADRRIMSPAPTRRPTPATDSDKHLRQDARLLREIAGDLKAFGPAAARVPNLVERLSALNADLMRLRRDLHAVRARFVDDQTRKLNLGSELKVHLGCGRHRLEGWANIDATCGDIRMDLRWPLPFADGSAKYVFASHVVEHFYRDTELPPLLKEVHRILEPGGVFRVIVPDIERCLRAYTSADDAFFVERKKTWPWAASCRTHLDHFLTYAGANQRLERFGGKYGFDFETLALALREAGFKQIARSAFMNSSHHALRVDGVSSNAQANVYGNYYSLFVEARRENSRA